jgi:hypothetical protein
MEFVTEYIVLIQNVFEKLAKIPAQKNHSFPAWHLISVELVILLYCSILTPAIL